MTKDVHIPYSDSRCGGVEGRKAEFKKCLLDGICHQSGNGLHGGGALRRKVGLRMTEVSGFGD